MAASTDSARDRQRQRLQTEINRYVGRGFRVLNQTDTTAQLVKSKKFSLLWFFIWLILDWALARSSTVAGTWRSGTSWSI